MYCIARETRDAYRALSFSNIQLATPSSTEYDQSWSKRNINHMVKFVEYFPDSEIVNAVSTQLSWVYFRQSMKVLLGRK